MDGDEDRDVLAIRSSKTTLSLVLGRRDAAAFSLSSLDPLHGRPADTFCGVLTIENNVIDEACYSKGDCGAIRTFGRSNLAQTPVHDVYIRGNIIRDTLGNTDGTHPNFETLFSLAIYIDNYSRNVLVEDNTVTGSTWTGSSSRCAPRRRPTRPRWRRTRWVRRPSRSRPTESE